MVHLPRWQTPAGEMPERRFVEFPRLLGVMRGACIRIEPASVSQYRMFDDSGYRQVKDGAASVADEHLVQLLRRCAGRDSMALRELYNALSPIMMGVALRLLRDRSRAEEALQEAFLQIWRNADRFDPGRGSARAWMIGIVRYRVLDRLETERRHGATGEVPDTPDEPAVSIEDSHALAGCIGELPEAWRRAVVLSYMEGYSHSEIAGMTETPLGTVKSWILRSLAALRKCLDR